MTNNSPATNTAFLTTTKTMTMTEKTTMTMLRTNLKSIVRTLGLMMMVYHSSWKVCHFNSKAVMSSLYHHRIISKSSTMWCLQLTKLKKRLR